MAGAVANDIKLEGRGPELRSGGARRRDRTPVAGLPPPPPDSLIFESSGLDDAWREIRRRSKETTEDAADKLPSGGRR